MRNIGGDCHLQTSPKKLQQMYTVDRLITYLNEAMTSHTTELTNTSFRQASGSVDVIIRMLHQRPMCCGAVGASITNYTDHDWVNFATMVLKLMEEGALEYHTNRRLDIKLELDRSVCLHVEAMAYYWESLRQEVPNKATTTISDVSTTLASGPSGQRAMVGPRKTSISLCRCTAKCLRWVPRLPACRLRSKTMLYQTKPNNRSQARYRPAALRGSEIFSGRDVIRHTAQSAETISEG